MKIGIALSALVLPMASASASAGQSRAVMSVTAVVTPACSVASRHPAAIACSSGATVSTMTAVRHDARPVAEAEAQLGRPVRRGRAVVFTTPVAPLPGAETAGPATRFLTITY